MTPRDPRRERRRRRAFVLIDRRRPPWRRWFPVLVALALLVAAPMFAYAQSPDSVALAWTESGDDGNVGTPTTVELRYATSPITLATWDAAALVPNLPVPSPSGTPRRVVVHGLSFGTTYYFALRSSDEAGNWSGLSNPVAWTWTLDTTPPGAPAGLTVSRSGAGAHLAWAANSDPDLAGYEVFRGGSSTGTFALACDSLLPAPSFDDPSLANGGAAWYRVVALDLSGNASAPSAAVAISLEKSDIVLQPAYPNPSPLSGPVRIPALIAAAHPGARLDVLDSGGRRVRVLDLSGLTPGSTDVIWDGRNDAGRPVAPGVYSAVLRNAGVSQVVRLVRVP